MPIPTSLIKSEPHKIVHDLELVEPVLTGNELRCPRCLSSWDGGPIPENVRQHYSEPYRWSKLIGIELPNVYDGVAIWRCPACKTQFPRFEWARKFCDKKA